MPSYTQWMAASLLVALGTAAPFKSDFKTHAKKQFTVHQGIPKPMKSGPAALASVYDKFHGTMPSGLAAAAATNDGTVTASPTQFDSSYLCPVTVGGQVLQLDFDTGSSDLWVFSTELPPADTSGHTLYNPKNGTKVNGASWSITYGDGSSSSGDVYRDAVSIGATTVAGQIVEAAKVVSTQFVQNAGTDGLVGLAFDQINTVTPNKAKTFITNALSGLTSPVFTADLKKGAPGSYDFGKIDPAKHTGPITYVPIDTAQGFWTFISDGYTVGTNAPVTSSIVGIADTGTTLLLLPDAIVTDYYNSVPGSSLDSTQGGYTFPCSTALPDFTVSIGGYNAVIPGSYMNYAPTSGSTCFGGLQSSAGVGTNIFGDIFLKSQFVVFDRGVPQLGLASKPV